MISFKFLLVISMLCKTEWSWELRAWSYRMNLLDISWTSPHYFYSKRIGATFMRIQILILRFKGLIKGLKHFYRLKLMKGHWSALSLEENFQSRMEFPTCCWMKMKFNYYILFWKWAKVWFYMSHMTSQGKVSSV